ncbi:MAG: phosphoglucomutase/phosphomannomutase family protein [Chloroflexi bacterium]|nr:phosphoglucomutase/phosphomannomutase family protein [Chloroflexota bacterium]
MASDNSTSESPIRFGTDGWRALIARDYTFANVRACAHGVCRLLAAHGDAERGLVVGYDTRFGSAEFAAEVAAVATSLGVPTTLADRAVPTPVVSFEVIRRRAGGGVVITASHNSGAWNGFKYKPDYGGSAAPEIVAELEAHIAAALAEGAEAEPPRPAPGLLTTTELAPPYMANLAGVVDLDAIRGAGLRVGFDAMHGAGAGYLEAALGAGPTTVIEMRGERNPAFPGMRQPEPIAPNLAPSAAAARDGRFDVVVANDGDADRLGVLDERGAFISTLDVFSLLCLHQLEGRGLRGPLVRSITQSAMVDKLGALFDVPVHRTAVGFKFLGPVMMETDAVAAGEESGGYAFRGNIPERDGILSALLFLDLMVHTGKRPSELVAYLHEKVGAHAYDRLDVALEAGARPLDVAALAAAPPERLAGLRVEGTEAADGVRYLLEDGFWGLIRPSGTEPLLRIYAEGDSPQRVREMLEALRGLAGV